MQSRWKNSFGLCYSKQGIDLLIDASFLRDEIKTFYKNAYKEKQAFSWRPCVIAREKSSGMIFNEFHAKALWRKGIFWKLIRDAYPPVNHIPDFFVSFFMAPLRHCERKSLGMIFNKFHAKAPWRKGIFWKLIRDAYPSVDYIPDFFCELFHGALASLREKKSRHDLQ